MSNVLSVRRHTLEIFCIACSKFLGVHDVRQHMPAYCSVPLTYAKLMPNVCNVHQRMDKISHTSAYVGAIRFGVSTPNVAMLMNRLAYSTKKKYSHLATTSILHVYL